MDPKYLFGEKAEYYAKFRPGYPSEAIEFLRRFLALDRQSIIADVGSGTGIFSRLLIDAGYIVLGIEPDPLMRRAAIEGLGSSPRFRSVVGCAEDTGLPSASVDLVTAAQSFHWFDPVRSCSEFNRILKVGGSVVLVWNERRSGGSPFVDALHLLLKRMLEEYNGDSSLYEAKPQSLAATLFGDSRSTVESFPNRQVLDQHGLIGRVMSSSYAPSTSHPRHLDWCAALEELYLKHCDRSGVTIEYDTVLIHGSPLAGGPRPTS